MKKLCPNLDREDALETVLEVPIPEEIFTTKTGTTTRAWQNMKSWMMKPNIESRSSSLFGDRITDIQLLLGVIGAPLIPIPTSEFQQQPFIHGSIKTQNIEASMARYIVKQYVAAVGGEGALNSVESMCATGQVRIGTSEFTTGECGVKSKKKMDKEVQMGGFVLWQKRPELWCLELVVSGYKISAGSDGKVAWRQTPWHHSHASKGPPRPLRRLLQGLDPRLTANLFNNSTCTGEKTVNNEECFVLKLEAESNSLRARSSSNVEIISHTVLGYFSQRTGLLVQLEDSHLLKLKSPESDDTIFWETNTESSIQDYRTVDGISIAHSGVTWVSLSRFGEGGPVESHSRTRVKEVWQIEEVDFNIKGLSIDCFLPPSDLKKEEEKGVVAAECASLRLQNKIRSSSVKISASKVAAINLDDS
ncbi:uncharacterized protein LOC130733642 [Lotus japonicus]|uniref:uncharacterized protein LOC130733642 n=1 Tax=Lotus japonicus TaxID=34305 RepID=UPI00258ABB57|nr:uncharacterized protein LOC130733642 [Lotus japonicus]